MTSLFGFPEVVEAEVFAVLPDGMRVRDRDSAWVAANKPGQACDSFLEGPSFDRAGNLYLVDIPYGRVLRVAPDGGWTVVAEYDGWPNGLKIDRQGGILIADYRRGLVALDPASGAVTPVLETAGSEGFKGCNDLVLHADGRVFFTDQGQTGLHDPTGRVFAYDRRSGHLERLIGTGPSPNGLVFDLEDRALLVAMTRAGEVWRLPFVPQGGVAKVGLFARVPAGTSGPDGMALDVEGAVHVCHASLGRVFVYDRRGLPLREIRCDHIGWTATNLAFGGPDGRDLFVTLSDVGIVARARTPVAGRPMVSHQ